MLNDNDDDDDQDIHTHTHECNIINSTNRFLLLFILIKKKLGIGTEHCHWQLSSKKIK